MTMNKGFALSLRFYRRAILSKWLIFAFLTAAIALSGCSATRSVRNGYYGKPIRKPLTETADKQKVNSEISEFEEMVLAGKNDEPTEEAAEEVAPAGESGGGDNALTNAVKRLPTLREQMLQIGEEQQNISRSVGALESGYGELKSEVGEIKRDIKEIKAMLQNGSAQNHGEASKGEPVRERRVEKQRSVSEPNIILSDEEVREQTGVPKRQKTRKATVSAQPAAKPVKPTSAVPEPKPAETAPEQDVPNVEGGELILAIEAYKQKNYDRAITQLNALASKQDDPKVKTKCYYYLGESHFGLKQYDKAIGFFERVVTSKYASDPDAAQIMIAESHIRSGRVAQAKDSYEQLIKNYPRSRHVPQARKMLQQL